MAMFIRVQLDPALYQLLHTQAKAEGRTVSNLVRFALRNHLAEHVETKGIKEGAPRPALQVPDAFDDSDIFNDDPT